ncbi:hypothetical protein HDF24_05165 [Mucilaginibacter sp. X4EP1]|uniref:hypothetical protein n=1 Tax=Mucilaginibacter sp. X4EP1 TaxID=2723092 RepID=UPI002169367A|nr:hypothetical protein [Mucilaginibacter sp. X4EP1]MCS3814520.1 hypothetical protein [Mucilaginibacter sp. X4EP1]
MVKFFGNTDQTLRLGGADTGGEITYARLLRLFILLLARINFMNRKPSRNKKRAHKVSVRKVTDSLRSQLNFQFFRDSFALALLSFQIAKQIQYPRKQTFGYNPNRLTTMKMYPGAIHKEIAAY